MLLGVTRHEGIPVSQGQLAEIAFLQREIKCNLNPDLSLMPTKETDLTAVPAKTVSEISGGGALLVHQQQGGKQSLQLQWDDSDLHRGMGNASLFCILFL